jgi:predicted RNA-binding protein with PIN domain
MAGRQVLIDGYNVIRADATLLALESRSLEEARSALIRMVSASPRFLGDAVTIVFDGAGNRSFGAIERVGHVSSMYSNQGSTADDVIKARASAARDPTSVVVVTDDADIRLHCERAGCTVTGSRNLIEQLAIPKKARRVQSVSHDAEVEPPSRGTTKKGNPRKLPKRQRNQRDYRF